ncbi:DUF885 family protein, partial [Glutamicibacter protophormiae]
MNNETSPRAATAIDAVADEHFEHTLQIYPELGAELGLPGYESLYGDYSPAGTQRYAEATRGTLAKLGELQPADDIDKVTLDAMQERLGLELEIIATGRTELNNIACPAQEIRAIFDLMPQESAEDFGHIARRLANLPAAMDGFIESLRESAAKGLVAARRQVKIVMEQSTDYAKDGGFFDELAADGA